MQKFLNNLWQDEHGFIVSSELIFVATLLVIGMVTGLTTIRDQVLGELADVADAVSELDQSYSIGAITAHASSSNGVNFDDENDFCEANTGASDQDDADLAQCLVATAGTSEQ